MDKREGRHYSEVVRETISGRHTASAWHTQDPCKCLFLPELVPLRMGATWLGVEDIDALLLPSLSSKDG